MRTRICALMLLALTGCGWQYKFKPHGVQDVAMASAQLTPEEKDAQNMQYRRDWADCTEHGFALQTYSSGWGASQGSGGGYGGSQFNASVFVNCMQARGYDYAGKSPTFLGLALF